MQNSLNSIFFLRVIKDLELQVVLNNSTIAKKYKMVYIIWIRQYTRKIVSNYEATIKYWQTLNVIKKNIIKAYLTVNNL